MFHVTVLYFVYLNQTMINSYDKNNFVFQKLIKNKLFLLW